MLIVGSAASGGAKPGTPTIGTVTSTSSQTATVPFTAPTYTGKGGTVTYVATSSPDSITGSSTTSPITVTGLTNGTAYTFTVVAQTSYGVNSSASSASNSVTPAGAYSLSQTFNASGTYTVPSGKSKMAVYIIGGGLVNANAVGNLPRPGGAGGGVIAFQDYTVSPSQAYTIAVGGSGGGTSSISISGTTLASVNGQGTFASNVSGWVAGNGGNGGNEGTTNGTNGNGNVGGNGGAGGNVTLNAAGLTTYQAGSGLYSSNISNVL